MTQNSKSDFKKFRIYKDSIRFYGRHKAGQKGKAKAIRINA